MKSKNPTVAAIIPILILLGACGGRKPAANATATPPVNIANDNITIADSGIVEQGPALSGTLTPERSAQIRAQVGGAILGVYVSEGAAVSTGQLVALIDTVALADAARSARSQLISAQLGVDVAKRNYERSQTLHTAGAIADRDLENAHNQSVASEAVLADARSRVTGAEKMLSNASIRAPFSGVVSDRPANAGDVVQVGAPILTIVDPTLLRLEASVPADELVTVKAGAKVEFNVTGFAGRRFAGKVARINPTVDPTTRQVRLYVTVPNGDRTIVAGAFAEGRVAVTSVRGLTVPTAAIDPRAAMPSVKRVHNGIVESVPVTLGVRDDVAERVQIKKGISVGDTVLIGGALGTPVGAVIRPAQADH